MGVGCDVGGELETTNGLRRAKRHGGVTFIEVLVASLIAALLAGGTLMAFVLSAKLTRESVTVVEAADYAVQTIERFRNHIACDDQWFNDSPTCNFGGLPDSDLPVIPVADPLPGPTNPPTSALVGLGATRGYRVLPADCDGDSVNGDCYEVAVTVIWTPPI